MYSSPVAGNPPVHLTSAVAVVFAVAAAPTAVDVSPLLPCPLLRKCIVDIAAACRSLVVVVVVVVVEVVEVVGPGIGVDREGKATRCFE